MKKTLLVGVITIVLLSGCTQTNVHEDGSEHAEWERCGTTEDCHGEEVCHDGYCELEEVHMEE